MKTIPSLGLMFGVAAVMVGVLVGVNGIIDIGLLLVFAAGVGFLAGPLVALTLARRGDPDR
ncbi:MAG: hypothetical protein R2695_12285 [Acidimicrobiales bacterium]